MTSDPLHSFQSIVDFPPTAYLSTFIPDAAQRPDDDRKVARLIAAGR
jgi:hypothetical protein